MFFVFKYCPRVKPVMLATTIIRGELHMDRLCPQILILDCYTSLSYRGLLLALETSDTTGTSMSAP